MIGSENREFGETWNTVEGFAAYVQKIRRDADEDAPRPARWVPCTTLWYVEDAEYLGRLAIRHRLTDFLRDSGGHIGYDVRPTARRREMRPPCWGRRSPWRGHLASTRCSSPATPTTSPHGK
jgi:predicted acetyltransferase